MLEDYFTTSAPPGKVDRAITDQRQFALQQRHVKMCPARQFSREAFREKMGSVLRERLEESSKHG